MKNILDRIRNIEESKKSGIMVYHENGLSTETVWYNSTTVYKINRYLNNVLHGISSEYYYSGIKKEDVLWENGKKIQVTSYYIDGKTPYTIIQYSGGIIHGTYEVFNDNGKHRRKDLYQNGKRIKSLL